MELSKLFFPMFERLLNEGKFRTHSTQQVKGGLEGIIEGLKLLKSGSVFGKKLVAILSDEWTLKTHFERLSVLT